MDMCVSLGTHTHSSQVTQCPLLPQQAPSDLCRVGVPARPGSGGGGCGGGLGTLSSSHSSLPGPRKHCKIQTKQGRAEETTLPNTLTFPGVM